MTLHYRLQLLLVSLLSILASSCRTRDFYSDSDLVNHTQISSFEEKQTHLNQSINSMRTFGSSIILTSKILGTPQVLTHLEWNAFVKKNNSLIASGKDPEGPALRLLDKLYRDGAFKKMLSKRIELLEGFTIVMTGALIFGNAASILLTENVDEAQLIETIIPDITRGITMISMGSISALMWAAKNQGDPDAKAITHFFSGLVGHRLNVAMNDNILEKQSVRSKLDSISKKITIARRVVYLYQGINRLSECAQQFNFAQKSTNYLDIVNHTEQAISFCGSGANLLASEFSGNKAHVIPFALFELAILIRSFEGEPPLVGSLIASLRKTYLEEPAVRSAFVKSLDANQELVYNVWITSWERGCRTISTKIDCSKTDENIEQKIRHGLLLVHRGKSESAPYYPAYHIAKNRNTDLVRLKYISMILAAYRGDRAKIKSELGF